jgi:hypothetical protein
MILLTGFYSERDHARRRELLECLRRNCAVGCIDEIHLLLEEAAAPDQVMHSFVELQHPKIRLLPHGRRATFADYFAHCNSRCGGDRTIIANADIYFDASLGRLNDVDLTGKMLCLSRWDVLCDGSARLFESAASQDAWIFTPPVCIAECSFFLGTPGCDGRLAWQAQQAGLQVSNPARSIRAYHLHQTSIRHYTERQRLRGSYHSIVATYLEEPWIWFVVTCRSRLADLKQSLPTLLRQKSATVIVLDYGCEQGTGAWVAGTYPQVRAGHVPHRVLYDGSRARNAGAALVDDDGIICFVDADMHARDGLSVRLLAEFRPGTFMVPDRSGYGYDNVVVVAKRDFDAIGGFDIAYRGVGLEVADLRERLESAGLRRCKFPAQLLHHVPQAHEAACGDEHREWQTIRLSIHCAYKRAKKAVAGEASSYTLSEPSRNGIYHSIAAHHWSQYANCRSATVIGFREQMGYNVTRLEPGASSHKNLSRPFFTIDQSLRGLQFTQVVASKVSAVELRFLSPGKLYVLVGTDWEGQWPARDWLRQHGRREPIPAATTAVGTAFEVWSLGGDIGDEHIIPTQVMLVADRLDRY